MKENRVLTDTGYNADAPQKRYAKQKKKKETEGHKLYGSIYVKH